MLRVTAGVRYDLEHPGDRLPESLRHVRDRRRQISEPGERIGERRPHSDADHHLASRLTPAIPAWRSAAALRVRGVHMREDTPW